MRDYIQSNWGGLLVSFMIGILFSIGAAIISDLNDVSDFLVARKNCEEEKKKLKDDLRLMEEKHIDESAKHQKECLRKVAKTEDKYEYVLTRQRKRINNLTSPQDCKEKEIVYNEGPHEILLHVRDCLYYIEDNYLDSIPNEIITLTSIKSTVSNYLKARP